MLITEITFYSSEAETPNFQINTDVVEMKLKIFFYLLKHPFELAPLG